MINFDQILSYHIIGSFDREIDKTFSNLTNKLQFFLFKDVATRPEVYFLMVRYANKDYLTWRDLQVFLETEQGVMICYYLKKIYVIGCF